MLSKWENIPFCTAGLQVGPGVRRSSCDRRLFSSPRAGVLLQCNGCGVADTVLLCHEVRSGKGAHLLKGKGKFLTNGGLQKTSQNTMHAQSLNLNALERASQRAGEHTLEDSRVGTHGVGPRGGGAADGRAEGRAFRL